MTIEHISDLVNYDSTAFLGVNEDRRQALRV